MKLEKLKALLKQWEDGIINLGEVESDYPVIKDLIDFFKDNDEWMSISSCCCSSEHNESPVITKLEIIETAHQTIIRKII